jgi:N-methylhydantoinase A/oxoprolinase/acetone carboxylase beta subunit
MPTKLVVRRYLADTERSRQGGCACAAAGHAVARRSAGGAIARQRPARLFLPPAAGAIGGLAAGQEAGFDNPITIDVGGTRAISP